MSTSLAEVARQLSAEIGKVIVGQAAVIEQVLVGFFTGGHILLEGVPGTAKTLLAKTLAHCIGAEFKRIQFTPDLMPADIVGTNVFNLASNAFVLSRGPVFTDLLLADEINRTSPKTQSALMEAMEERQVTIDGVLHPLSSIFFVIATQNPIEFGGTFPLPEAQVDRFLMKVVLDYPSETEEIDILKKHHSGFDPHRLDALDLTRVVGKEDLPALKASIRKITVEESVLGYIGEIARTSRRAPMIALGASPRAGAYLLLAAKTLTALRGNEFVTPDQVKEVAHPVLRHRLLLKAEAEVKGVAVEDVISGLLAEVAVPR